MDDQQILTGSFLINAGFADHHRHYHQVKRNGLVHYLFRLQTDGNALALVNGQMTEVKSGDLLLFAPGEAYELQIGDEARQMATHSSDLFMFCYGPWIDCWWKKRKRPTHQRLSVHEQCIHLWRQIIEEHRRPGRKNEELCDYLLRALCLTVDQYAHPVNTSCAVPLAAERMKWFIEQHVTEPITLKHVADEVDLSVSRAVHLYKATYGHTIVQYLLQIRLQMACDRIRYSNYTLEQVAEACGFRSYSYFYRVFKAQYGVSPRLFRLKEQ